MAVNATTAKVSKLHKAVHQAAQQLPGLEQQALKLEARTTDGLLSIDIVTGRHFVA